MESLSTNGIPSLDRFINEFRSSDKDETLPVSIGVLAQIGRQFIKTIWPNTTDDLDDLSEIFYNPMSTQQDALMDFVRRQEKISRNLAEFSGDKGLDKRTYMLNEIFTFRRPEDVYALLHEDASLVDITHEAYIKIRKYFASDELFVEAFLDPNAPESKELLISIATDLPPDEAIKRLDAFDEDWWLNASMNYESNLCIKVEYK